MGGRGSGGGKRAGGGGGAAAGAGAASAMKAPEEYNNRIQAFRDLSENDKEKVLQNAESGSTITDSYGDIWRKQKDGGWKSRQAGEVRDYGQLSYILNRDGVRSTRFKKKK